LSGGHYWSYVKKGEKWYECNDATVSEVQMDKTLLNSLYGDGKKSDSAYILFYSKAE
jgi:ubiquitin C-terminal hydrolase